MQQQIEPSKRQKSWKLGSDLLPSSLQQKPQVLPNPPRSLQPHRTLSPNDPDLSKTSRIWRPALVRPHNPHLVPPVYLLDQGHLSEKRAVHETIIGETSRNNPGQRMALPHRIWGRINKYVRILEIGPTVPLQSLSLKSPKHLNPLLPPKKRINRSQSLRSCIYRVCLWHRVIQITNRRSRRTIRSTICWHGSKQQWVIDQKRIPQPVNPLRQCQNPLLPQRLLRPSPNSSTSLNLKFLDHLLPPGEHILSNYLEIARTFPNFRILND